MSLRKAFVRVLVLCLPALLIVGACKKKRAFNDENGQATVDERMTQGQNDEAIKDVNIAIMEQFLLRGRSTAQTAVNTMTTELCGVDIDTSGVFSGITALNYNGTACNGIKKTGKITITILDYPLHKWKNIGCTLKVDFAAYKVTRVSDGQSVQIDGTEYLKNETGDTWFELRYLNATSVVQTLTADNLKITFSGNNTAIYSINRRMTFTCSNLVMSCKIEGLGSSKGRDNLENWGQTRDGDNFTSQVSTPIVWKTSCGAIAPLEGELIIKVDGKDFDLKCDFAVDKDGNSVSGDNPCPFGWKMIWSYKSNTKTRVFGYN